MAKKVSAVVRGAAPSLKASAKSGVRSHGRAKVLGQGRSPSAALYRADAVGRDRPPFAAFYQADPLERVRLVRAGVPVSLLTRLSEEMAIPQSKLYTMMGLPRGTIVRKVSKAGVLNKDESEHVLGFARLVGQVETIVRESGSEKGFDAAKWTASWLDRPHPALGGKRPAELMDTADGRGIVSDLIAQMQSGAYA